MMTEEQAMIGQTKANAGILHCVQDDGIGDGKVSRSV